MAMKLMRFALVAVVILAVFDGTEQTCSRSDKSLHMKIYRETWCRDPVDTSVPLPVPEGYKYVMPSVVKLKRCSGMECNKNLGEQCVAKEESIKKRFYNVNAYLSENPKEASCKQVEVEEHEACDCQCSRTCKKGRVLDKGTCQCVCNSEDKDECIKRRDVEGYDVMYSDQECKCVCDPNAQEDCGTGQRRNDFTCRCENTFRRAYDYPDSFEDDNM